MKRRSVSVRKGSRLVGAEEKIENRQMLIKTGSKFQPTAPLIANRGPEISGDPLCLPYHQKARKSCYEC